MKILNNGIEITEAQDEALVKKYYGGFVLACILTLSAIALGTVKAQEVEFTKDHLGEPINAFYLGVDLDALSYAVGRQETGNCAIETNFTIVNNCHGIKIQGRPAAFPAWINGKRWETSSDYFKDLWTRKYNGYVTMDKAKKYSGNDRANYWYRNVKQFYAEATKTKLTF